MDQLVEAITRLAIRGAPVLGAAGALGVALAARQAGREGWDGPRLDAEIKRIADARPTAVNLRREVTAVAAQLPQGGQAVEAAALAVVEFAATASYQISRRGAAYLRDRLRPRAAPDPHPLQHRPPRLPGLGHRARGDPRAARRRARSAT